ncbi:MAG: Choline dehydrogenase [Actinomycetia bacterium]|nr:Choline dehydrogenase [Actinomycetes bacterium]
MDTAYDYVIVGAGSAGCVLAARLSEDPDVRVLLLEAGPPDDALEIRMPVGFTGLFKSRYDWGFETTPQEHAHGRRVYWAQGKTLGGSSSTNAMIYIRCNPYDFDTWRDVHGCEGWGYADVLPYFKKAEDQQRGESVFHGSGGPLRVEDLRYKHPLVRAWVEAARTTGLAANHDFNGSIQDGVGFYQVTQRRGRRWSAADAYLRPALRGSAGRDEQRGSAGRDEHHRPGNLTVRTDALVTKVVVESGRAAGVRYRHNGAERTARAEREVILSGGAINSPQLLMLSGIGPADHLREHGIDVLVDAPVGEGLQDHPNLAMMWHTPGTKGLWEGMTRANVALWQTLGRGPLSSNLAEGGGFVRSRDGLPAPDLQYHVVAAPFVRQGLGQPTIRTVSVLITPLVMASRGRVTLRSADPRWKPVMDPAYLSERADVDLFVHGVRQSREIAAQQPLARLIAGESAPGEQLTGDAELREWIRANSGAAYHPTSTCAMGGAETAVCDPELRVRGVGGLRVVDASVLPEVPRGDTNAPTIMLAERAADLIRGHKPLDPAVLG